MTSAKGSSRVLVGASLILGVVLTMVLHHSLNPRIDSARQTLEAQALLSVLPNDLYDNQPLRQPLALTQPDSAPAVKNAFLASRAGQPAALLFHSQAQGYAGPIDLLIGVDMSGHLTGLKVASQQETPGLGGQIVSQPDWLQGFVGTSLAQPEEAEWALKKDHGGFDQLAGATLTSRAVVDTLRQTLRYFDQQHAALLAQPAARQP